MAGVYQMPKAEIGDTVLWFTEGSGDMAHAHAAIVERVHEHTLDLTVFIPQRNPVQRFNVRHVTDPYLVEKMDRDMKREAGGWDLSPMMKRLINVENALMDQTKSRSSK